MRVVIVTPANSFMPIYVSSILETQIFAYENNISIKFATLDGSNVSELRETLAKNLVEHTEDYDKIIWIDSDIKWSPQDFVNIINSPYDVTCGAYMIYPDGKLSVGMHEPNGSIRHLNCYSMKVTSRYIPVDMSGFGFICMNNGVFESMTKPYFSNAVVDISQDGVLTKEIVLSEDASWSIHAFNAGYKIMFDTQILLGHQKKTIWMPNIRQ